MSDFYEFLIVISLIIYEFLIVISLINFAFLVLSSKRPQSGDRVTLGDIWDSVAPHAWIVMLAFSEVLGGWFLFPAIIGRLSEIQAVHPELASGPNAWVIAAIPLVFAAILAIIPLVFVLQKIEEGKHR